MLAARRAAALAALLGDDALEARDSSLPGPESDSFSDTVRVVGKAPSASARSLSDALAVSLLAFASARIPSTSVSSPASPRGSAEARLDLPR